MSKIIPATCVGGVVTAEGVPVPGAVILSEGVGQSSGYLVLDGSEKTYIPKTSPDLKSSIQSLSSIIEKVAQILTSLDAVSTTPGSVAATIAELTALKVTFSATKDALK